ncbi:MAG: hypothetical protein Q8O43_09085 [Dehalococcoidia bacterium]|nr:hypothetical protein [Dehalococcoidia bacterium]
MGRTTTAVLFFILSLSLITILFYSPNPTLATTEEAKWSPVPLPVEGATGKWALAPGSDAKYLTAATDGTLYCYATPSSTSDTLFKSTDGGLSWLSVGRVSDVIIDIAVVAGNPAEVYYTTASRIHKSINAGATFTALAANPGGAAAGNIRITSLDVTRMGGSNLVVVSTRDTDAGQFGGVYLFDESAPLAGWLDTVIGSYDVLRTAFSPDYTNDRTLIAIATDETDMFVKTAINIGAWGQVTGDARLNGVVPVSVAIAFPASYRTNHTFYIGTDTGADGGNVYKITPALAPAMSVINTLGVGSGEGLGSVDVSSLSAIGDASSTTLLAGCARSARIYISRDGGTTWTRSQKPPTGQSETYAIFAPDSPGGQKVFTVTSGVDSAFSISTDGGGTWNQTGLIDAKITGLIDFAAAPGTPASLFLLTHDNVTGKYSLWRSEDGGTHWQRVFSASLPGVDSFNLIESSPQNSAFSVVCIAGRSNGNPALWQSTDSGQTFSLRAAPLTINVLAMVDKNTFFAGGYDGSKGLVYRTGNGGIFYSEPLEVGTKALHSLGISPDFGHDRMVAVGNIFGQVFLSTDGGVSFQQVGQQLPVSAGLSRVTITFDRDYKANGVLYAATDTKVTSASRERLFRLAVGRDTAWQSIHSSLPDNAILNQIAVTKDGALYAIDGQAVVTASGKGGAHRALTPSAQPAPSFETALRGLNDGMSISGLWTHGSRLWSIDIANVALMTMVDSLAVLPVLKSPGDGIAGQDVDLRLEWQAVSGATEYEWQISDSADFSSLPSGFSGTTPSASVRATNLQPGTIYRWRVRVSKPFSGPWSAVQSFTTRLGGQNIYPELLQPSAGAKTALKPVFQWRPVAGADRYELMVSTDTSFADPSISRKKETALMANAWQCETALEYNTTYFWKVRACTATNYGDWSPVSAFTTESAPVPTPAPAPPLNGTPLKAQETPPPVQQVIILPSPPQSLPEQSFVTVQVSIPNWALYGGLVLMVIITLLLAALLVALMRRRQ